MPVYRLEVEVSPGRRDPAAHTLRRRFSEWESCEIAQLQQRKIYWLSMDAGPELAQALLDAIVDPVLERGALGSLPDPGEGWAGLEVQFRPGVTDCVGKSLLGVLRDLAQAQGVEPKADWQAFSGALYWAKGIDADELAQVASRVLYNPLIESAESMVAGRSARLVIPVASAEQKAEVAVVELRDANDDRLQEISKKGMLALSLEEMQAIRTHFQGLGRDPLDAELECLAQTWSEHCKHKIFASPIEIERADGRIDKIEEGIFSRYIKKATRDVEVKRKAARLDPADKDYLVSVFHDNAGVVRFTDQHHLAYKVETHNSPSALDPYGGAMTGIVGVNRDSFGTGRGAELLTNVWGYCLGAPDYAGQLPKGLMHPRRIREGVHAGVIDGGNHSGVPYSRGFELFDDRYVGKPLVYCGTVSVMPVQSAGKPTHEKFVQPGDRVVMVGGRIGKDGIHGATFSSLQLDESAPVQAVQIGDPLIQKMMWDMLSVARERGLYSGMTDNGAGGLSSSIGEMAELTGGAKIDLAKAPLKYSGLAPWEILVSEAQERMSVAVPPEHLEAFLSLANEMEVEATDLGAFSDSGRFVVEYAGVPVCDLCLEFLHEGVPLPSRRAKWEAPAKGPCAERLRASQGPAEIKADLLSLLASANLKSNEDLCRQYDHEVKGLSVVKPWVGQGQDIPAPATVMRAVHHRDEGVVLGEGVHPWYSDVQPYWMAVAGVDEAVRRILCAGGRWDRICALDNFCWPDPILSETTPDGPHKLAQLVMACEGLYDACVSYGVPLVSGKDSMKNDAYFEGKKISIPPTLLVSAMGQIQDVTRAMSLDAAMPGDQLFLLGRSQAQLAGSQWALLHDAQEGDDGPTCDLQEQLKIYEALSALIDEGAIAGMTLCARGGLALAVAHLQLANGLDLKVDLRGSAAGGLRPSELAFSESLGRLLVYLPCESVQRVQDRMAGLPLQRLGSFARAENEPSLHIHFEQGETICAQSELRAAFQGESA